MSTIRAFSRYIDGYYGTARRISRTPREYPFAHLGDVTTASYLATYLVEQSKFTPTARGTADPENAGFYLVAESKPMIETGDLATFTRTYAALPGSQTDYGRSLMVNRPSLSGTFPKVFGAYRILQPDTTLQLFDAYAAQTVLSDTGAPSLAPTGGTYTLTFGANTTGPLNYNDSAATVSTALNLLASITARGGCAVTGSYTAGFTVTFASYAQITIDTSSLTGGTVTAPVSFANGGYTQLIPAYLGPFPFGNGYPDVTGLTGVVGGGSLGLSAGQYIDVFFQGPITAGTFTWTAYAVTSGAIAYNATFATIQTALNAMGVGNCTVSSYLANADTVPLNGGNIRFRITCITAAVTGGTFTLTVGANTTAAIAYNATAAAVQTALNLLASVTARGGLTVSGGLHAGFALAFSNDSLTASAASLTPASAISILLADTPIGRVQSVALALLTATRDLYIPAHGLVVGDTLFVQSGISYFGGITTFTVPTPDIVRLAVYAASTYVTMATIAAAGKRTKQSYAPGSAPIPCVVITTFSLTPITPGTYQGEGDAFLQAIFSGSTAINYRVGDVTRWPNADSPILSLSTTQVSAANL